VDDPLVILLSVQTCPSCLAFEAAGSHQCLECGSFHGGAILSSVPPPQEEGEEATHVPDDLTMYSLNPHSEIISETFETSEQTVKPWKGGGTTFNLDEILEESE